MSSARWLYLKPFKIRIPEFPLHPLGTTNSSYSIECLYYYKIRNPYQNKSNQSQFRVLYEHLAQNLFKQDSPNLACFVTSYFHGIPNK